MERHNGQYAGSKRTRARPCRARTAAFARRELVAAAVARLCRHRLWRPGVLLAGPDADHLDLALGLLRPERRYHCHMDCVQRIRRRWWSALVAGPQWRR